MIDRYEKIIQEIHKHKGVEGEIFSVIQYFLEWLVAGKMFEFTI